METNKEGEKKIHSWEISGTWVHLFEVADGDGVKRFLFCQKCQQNNTFHPCEHVLKARRMARESFQENLRLRQPELSAKDAVLEVVYRVGRGDYLGEHTPGVVYLGDIVNILNLTDETARCVCDELLVDEKLEIKGGALKEYEPRFRFPEELRYLLSYLAEDYFVEGRDKNGEELLVEMEKAIQKSLGYSHCVDLFGPANTPHIKPQTVLLFIGGWIDSLIFRAKYCPHEAGSMRRHDVESIIAKAHELLDRTF